MKTTFLIPVFLAITIATGSAQGTIMLRNTVLSRAMIELVEGEFVDVPAGFPIVYGVFWGRSADTLELNAGPLGTASAAFAGLIDANSPYPIVGGAEGETVFMQIRVWSAAFDRDWRRAESTPGGYLGATLVRSIRLGPGIGPGAVVWSRSDTNLFQPLLIRGKIVRALTTSTEGGGTISRSPDLPLYELEQTVVLTARPNRWWTFERWTDGVRDNPRTVIIGGENEYAAVFLPEVPLETVTRGGVTREGPVGMPLIFVDGVFQVGSNVVVRGGATVSLDSTFPNHTLVYTMDGSEPEVADRLYFGPFVVRRSMTIRAVAYNGDFTRTVQSDSLTIQVLPLLTTGTSGGGTVAMDPPSGPYLPDGTATLTAVPAPGWAFLQWLGDASGIDPSATVAMTRNKCVQAIFGTPVNTSVAGAGSVVRPAAEAFYPYGAPVTLTAVPALGSYFAFWANAVTATNNPLVYSVTATDPTLVAVFSTLPAGSHALTVVPDGFGRVELSPRGHRFVNGANVTLTAVADPGQTFLGWGGIAGGTNNPLVVRMTQSRVITAMFTGRPRLAPLVCDGSLNRDEFPLLVTGEYGGAYVIESSPTLAPGSWTAIGILPTPYGSAQLTIPVSPGDGRRFYRAMERP